VSLYAGVFSSNAGEVSLHGTLDGAPFYGTLEPLAVGTLFYHGLLLYSLALALDFATRYIGTSERKTEKDGRFLLVAAAVIFISAIFLSGFAIMRIFGYTIPNLSDFLRSNPTVIKAIILSQGIFFAIEAALLMMKDILWRKTDDCMVNLRPR